MAEQKVRTRDAMAGLGADLAAAGLGFDEDISAVDEDRRYAHIDSLPTVALEQIHRDPNQPRNTEAFGALFALKGRELKALLDGDEEPGETFRAEHPRAWEVVELMRSIRAQGLLNPVTLRPRPRGGFHIVYGERRCTALRLLVQAGHTEFASVPFLEDARDLTRAEWLALQIAEDWHKSKHSVIDTVASIRRIADEKAEGRLEDVPATEIATALQIHYKAAQRYLRVAKTLSADEVDMIRSASEDVDLMPLLKLVEWLNAQARATRALSPSARTEAIARFAARHPKASSVKALLSEFTVAEERRGPGRPAKARYDVSATRTEGIHAHVRVPVTKLSRETVERAEARLRDALEKVTLLRREMFD